MHSVVRLKAPSHWASYLINGDASGLEASDRRSANRWIASIGVGPPVDVSEDHEFSRHHDAWDFSPLAADVATYSFLRPWTAAATDCGDGSLEALKKRADARGCFEALESMLSGDAVDAYSMRRGEKARHKRGTPVTVQAVQDDCVGDLIDSDDEIAGRFCLTRARRARQELQFRITYMMNGTGQHTGINYDRLVAEENLEKFRKWTKAWMQESRDNGRTWRTLD